MRTKFFSFWDPKSGSNDRFPPDVQQAMELPEETLFKLTEYVAPFALARSSTETRAVTKKAASECGLLPVQARKVLSLFYFLASEMLPEQDADDDDPEALAKDMADLELVAVDQIPVATQWLTRLRHVATAELLPRKRKEEIGLSVLPYLLRVDFTTDLRAVFETDFDPLKQDVDSFQPKCLGVEPVTILRLGLGNADHENISLQADRRSLRLLMQFLLAAEKEMDAIAHYLKLKPTGGK